MTEELYSKATEYVAEIETLKEMLERDIKYIYAIETYNYDNKDLRFFTRSYRITKELSDALLEVIKNRLKRLEEEFRNL